jgi:hypothetical protein
MTRVHLRCAVFLLLFLAGPALTVLAQGVGAIGGTVVDESSAVLPGVTVTLSSPGLIGGNQTAVTDGQGAYQFIRLVPGRYSVKAELSGFKSTLQENLVVDADKTSRADLKLAVGAVSEEMTVTGEAPVLDTTSALKQTVMTRELLDTLPLGNDIWSISRLAEGVHLSKYDVGGRQMLAQSNAVAHNSIERGYNVDGMDINSYSGGISFYVASFAFDEINYVSDNVPASSYEGGVVMNMITKTGTNNFHGSAMFQGSLHALESNNVTGDLATQISAGIPAKVVQVNPGLFLGGDLTRIFDTGFTIGGPIVRDHLWFAASGYLGELYSHLLGSYNSDGTLLLNDNTIKEPMGKISWAINKTNQLHVTESWVSVLRPHQAGGPTVTQYFASNAAFYNPSANVLQMARWTSVLSPRMLLDVAAVTTNGQTNDLFEPGVASGTIPVFDSVLLTNSGAAGTYPINGGRRTEFAATFTFANEKHNLSTGWQFFNTQNERGAFNSSSYPAGFQEVLANGVPSAVHTYNSPTDYINRTHETGVFLQDKWTPMNRLTLNLGIRFDKVYGWINDSPGFGLTVNATPLCQVQTVFLAGQCYPAVKGAPDYNLLSPHFSAVYDLTGDGKRALKFSANRYIVPQINTAQNLVVPITFGGSDTRAWTVCKAGQTSGCDLNGDGIPQLNEFGPSSGFNTGTTNHLDPNLKAPWDMEISAGFEQQLPGEMVASVAYYFRGYRNLIGPTNLAVPPSAYTPITVTEVNSGRQVTVYNQNPATRGQFNVQYSNLSALNSDFHGVDLNLTKRLSHHWSLMTNLSLGRSRGDIYCGQAACTNTTGDQNNPNITFRQGPSPMDVPVMFKASGVYELPYGISLGATGQYYRGWPDVTTVTVGPQTVALTQVTQVITVAPSGTTRLPSVNVYDFNVRKALKSGHLTVEPRMDIFNAFNQVAVTQRILTLGPTYDRPIAVLPGRLIKFGVNLRF